MLEHLKINALVKHCQYCTCKAPFSTTDLINSVNVAVDCDVNFKGEVAVAYPFTKLISAVWYSVIQ